jgi:phage shock protein A
VADADPTDYDAIRRALAEQRDEFVTAQAALAAIHATAAGLARVVEVGYADAEAREHFARAARIAGAAALAVPRTLAIWPPRV